MNISAEASKKSSAKPLFIIAISILITCGILFWLDYETKQFSDLLTPGNLAALALYFIPTFFIAGFLFEFLKKIGMKRALVFSILLGVPTSIALLICTLLIFKS